MEKYIVLSALISIIVCCNGAVLPNQARNKVLLVAMSSLRHDYIHNRPELETFNNLKDFGFYAKKMTVPFVTNHYTTLWSAATGHYPEEHGIIDSNMYDPVTKLNFRRNENNVGWYEKEPLWISAEREGVRTAVSWPGSSLTFGGVSATYSQDLVGGETRSGTSGRIITMVRWLNESADLGMIYLPQPDGAGHKYGVDSQELRNAVKENDNHLKLLLEQLEFHGILNQTNLIVFGEHGMANHRQGDVIILNKCFRAGRTTLLGSLGWYTGQSFSSGMLEPRNGSLEAVYSSLVGCHPNMTVYKKEDIPERFHIKNHRRVSPLLLIADEGYRMQMSGLPYTGELADKVVGAHGYDNQLSSMKSLMIANGPDFENRTVEDFNLINIYPRVCEILGIECPLREPEDESTEAPMTTQPTTTSDELSEITTQSLSEEPTETTTQTLSEEPIESTKDPIGIPFEPVFVEEPEEANMLEDEPNEHNHGNQIIMNKESSAHALYSSFTLLLVCLFTVL